MSERKSSAPRFKILDFAGDDLSVSWDLKRCIHAAECVRGLPSVFDPDRRPWIDPDRAPADEVREVVLRCPTGALHYENRHDEAGEPAPGENAARGGVDGPLYIEGDLILEHSGGEEMRETRVALCRCGASSNKPFCDNTHLETGFEDDGRLAEPRLGDEPCADRVLRIRSAPHGPLLLEGPVTLHCTVGEDQTGTRGALCRCGGSEARPYCDGTHASLGFTAE